MGVENNIQFKIGICEFGFIVVFVVAESSLFSIELLSHQVLCLHLFCHLSVYQYPVSVSLYHLVYESEEMTK